MIIPLLKEVDSKGIEYVSWKNNHELNKVLSGNSDLDLYVPLIFKDKLNKILQNYNWIEVINPIAIYPYIHHYYAIDKHLNVYHLHIYFKVITGESWLKEYDLPLDRYLINNRFLHSSGIYILNSEAQSFLFALRHFLKGSSFFSRFLYKKELKSYQNEWDLCKENFKPDNCENIIDLKKYIKSSGLESKLSLPDKKVAVRVRNELYKFIRVPVSKLFILRIKHFITRVCNKVFFRRNKILPKKGFILVFSGADGVGKSTMSESISNTYKKFLTIKNVQLGRPQSKFVEFLRRNINSKNNQNGSDTRVIKAKNNISIKKAISAVYLAYLRFNISRKVINISKKNYLIISDRWPTVDHFKMDGPKLNKNNLSGIKRKLAIIEEGLYDKISNADLCIILTVPIDVAIDRNRNRQKVGKETDEEIAQRHMDNMYHNPKSNIIIRFDNNGDLETKRFELIQIIQKNLNSIN